MIVINEFEFFEDGDTVCALPFDREGGTVGIDLHDAVYMAADWLYETVKQEAIEGIVTLDTGFGHKPEHGGIVIAVAVDFELSRVDAVTAADAARILGVSPARVTQMCESGQLTSWKDGSRRMVLRESVDARLANKPRAGRPRTIEAAKEQFRKELQEDLHLLEEAIAEDDGARYTFEEVKQELGL